MLTKLTKAQEALMPKKVDEWVNFALFSGDEVDQKACYDGIDFIYKLSGLKKPIKIIVDSPLAVQFAIPYAKALLDALGKGVKGSQVHSQVDSQVYSQVCSQVDSQVGSQVRSQVRSQVYSQVYSQVGSQVGSPETFAYDTMAWYAGWCAWIDFFKDLGIVNFDKWDEYVKYMKSGQFMGVYLDGLAVVCRRPQSVHRDEQLNLHSDSAPAIEWRDGYKLWFLKGEAFDEELWTKITTKTITASEVMKISDVDKRTIAISMLSPKEMLKQLKAVLIDTGSEGTRLYECKNFMDTGKTEYAMLMKDWSTPREFIEFVPPKIGKEKDAVFAQASAYGIPVEDYLAIKDRG